MMRPRAGAEGPILARPAAEAGVARNPDVQRQGVVRERAGDIHGAGRRAVEPRPADVRASSIASMGTRTDAVGSLASRAARSGALVAAALLLATLAVGALESILGLLNASMVYLVAVVICGVAVGTWAAVGASIASFLLYDFLFIPPLYTFTVADPAEWLNLFLLLFAGVVVGRLAGLQRERAEDALAREREARALFGVSRVLATREATEAALAQLVGTLRDEAGMRRVWIGFGADPATERVAADSRAAQSRPRPTRLRVLQRKPGDEPAAWTLVVQPGRTARATGSDLYRVRIEASGEGLGSVWAERDTAAGEPDRSQTRLLAGAADMLGQAVARDRVAHEMQAAEVARQGDQLKTSLLQSVSHDFRTPLAVIRAAAGSLDSDTALAPEDRHANAQAIEREVEYLNALVANLLDMSRIEAGALRAERDVYDLDDLLTQPLERVRRRLAGRPLLVEVEPAMVRVDPVFVDSAVTNVLDNAIKYTPADAPIRVTAAPLDPTTVRLTIEDGGPGVAHDALPRLFEKFYRAPGARGGSRGGLGIGLAVVKGLIEATGGRVAFRRGALGGLAVDIDLPAVAGTPVDDAAEAGA
jgi:two-component system sensor histidine kinase KdpD